MMDKFNFYDIYGYLLPGFTLLALICLPFGLTQGHWPTAELSSALFAIVFAYIIGHILQSIARNAIAPKIKDSAGKRRYPSDMVLDPGDESLSADLKKGLAECIKKTFNIDIGVEKNRGDAFFLCRDVLIKTKAVSYAEQSQGMYALMMGLTAAFALGAAYHFGWWISGLRRETFEIIFEIILIVALGIDLIIAISLLGRSNFGRDTRSLALAVFLAVALFATGYLWGLPQWTSPDQRMRLFAVALLGVFFSVACFAAEKYFAHEFAVAVYRAFYTHQKSKEEVAQNTDGRGL